jgi:AraC-like DNA-binding protein
VHLVRSRPHPELTGLVGGYADFSQRSTGPVESREAANAKIVVIVDLDAGWTVEGERVRSFAGGLYARPVRVRHEGSAAGVQIDLEPVAARALLGVPAGELANRTVGLESLIGARADEVAERLHGAAGAAERFAILDGVLRRALAGAREACRPDTLRAWTLLERSGGRMRVEALAAELGCSRRHLVNRFAADIGAPPKLAARLIRFENARRRLGSAPLVRLAAECGYADQAHMAREFSALAGRPPTAFPFVQDGRAAAA